MDEEKSQGDDDKKHSLTREIRFMMYGFGDDPNPYSQSVSLIEDIVISYITEIVQKAHGMGKKGKVNVEDIVHLVHHDPKKYGRVKELLIMNEELKKARKAFEEDSFS